MEKKCAPDKKYIDNSCFTYESLIKIANNYNKKNNNKININLNKIELVNELEDRLSDKCSDQICWLRLDLIKELNNEEIDNYTFRPEGPSEQFEWLNTKHINDVIDQYHNMYSDFLYLGAVPSDFEELPVLGLNDINFKELESNNKNRIGIVINLDEHYKGGSHWVALFFDLKNYQIYYYDSVGKSPKKRIRRFINKILQYLYFKKFNIKLNINHLLKILKKYKNNDDDNENKNNIHIQNLLSNEIDIRYNNVQHQFKNSECGVYSIYFIIRILNGESIDSIINNPINDDNINKFREEFFYNVDFNKIL